MTITFIYRKKHPAYFSIEKVFEVLTKELKTEKTNAIILPLTSTGVLAVFINVLYLKWKTTNCNKCIFHITGDIHYAMLVLPPQRTVLTIHDLVFLHTYKGLTRKILKWLYLDQPIQRAKWITTISEKSKNEILENSAADPDTIMVIPNPIDPYFTNDDALLNDADHRSAQTAATEFTPADESRRFKILFLGTKANKNLELTIAALYQLPIHLRIIGKLEPRQKKLLKKFKIDFSNAYSISQEKLLEEYQETDIVLFPSTYEGFGLPVIEAFATGKPVITSNLSPMKEVVSDAALLIDPSSIASIRKGVQELIESATLRSQLSQAGKLRAKAFLPSQILDQYKSVWENAYRKAHPSQP